VQSLSKFQCHSPQEINLKFHLEAQKTPNSQSNPEEKEQYLTSNYTTELSYQSSILLTQKQLTNGIKVQK
jgi:hypothetical protein